MQAKKILSLLLVLALALAIFALPAAAETHDHDGCADCAAESVILRRPPIAFCRLCGSEARYAGKNALGENMFRCTNSNCSRYGIAIPESGI